MLSKNIGVYSRNNPVNTMKDGAYAVNTHECKSIGTQQIDFYANGDIWHTLIALVLKKFQKKLRDLSATIIS